MKKFIASVCAVLCFLGFCVNAFAATPVEVTNGQVIVRPDYEEVCTLSVSVKGNDTYFVYLEYQKAPSYTTVNRTLRSEASSKKETDVGFIVAANSMAAVSVPIGVYKVYCCVGNTWYGSDEKFGEDTQYYSSDELLEFYVDSHQYQGRSIELSAQTGGNFGEYSISESSFPDIEETESTTSHEYLSTNDLINSASDDIDQIVKDWLAYPAYNDDFHAVNQEVTIKVGERTKLETFRNQWYYGAEYNYVWYGGGDVSMERAGNDVGWAGHNQVWYFTATEPCTIFVSATDIAGITAHMVIYAK